MTTNTERLDPEVATALVVAARGGDRIAMGLLLRSMEGACRKLAWQYGGKPGGHPTCARSLDGCRHCWPAWVQDLLGEARMAVLDAIQGYNAERGRWSTYAYACIRNGVQDARDRRARELKGTTPLNEATTASDGHDHRQRRAVPAGGTLMVGDPRPSEESLNEVGATPIKGETVTRTITALDRARFGTGLPVQCDAPEAPVPIKAEAIAPDTAHLLTALAAQAGKDGPRAMAGHRTTTPDEAQEAARLRLIELGAITADTTDEEIEQMIEERTTRPQRRRHPWTLYFNGELHELRHGEHFDTEPSNFRAQVMAEAHRKGFKGKVKTHVIEDRVFVRTTA